MSKLLLLLLGLSLVVAAVESKKGKKEKIESGGCIEKDKTSFRACLKKGFQSSMEGCQLVDGKPDMKQKEIKKCTALEKKLVKCEFNCSEKVPMNADEILETCSYQDMNFPGADMFNMIYILVEDCVRDCLRSDSCKAISYNTADKKCYFKSMEGGTSGPTVAAKYISTNMNCDRSRVDLRCQRRGFQYIGADISYGLKTDGIEDCVLLCRDTENCKALSYSVSTKYCNLKNKRGGSSGPYPQATYTSMNMECDTKPVTNWDCMREGIWFYSANLRSLAVANMEECVQHCKETEACKAITFQNSNHQCYLKSKYGGYYPRVYAGYRSMNMKCDNNSKVENLSCMREGFDYPGAHLGNLVVADEVECVKRCRETEDCKAISFRKSDSRCYLKRKAGGDTGPSVSAGYNSMNMVCDKTPVKNLDCIRLNTNFPGADLRNFLVNKTEECVMDCRDTESCKAVVLRKSGDQYRCYLKYRRGGSTVPVEAAGYDSMNMECDNSNVTNLNCLRRELSFAGADIGNTIVEDEKACVKVCRDTEGCKSFSFRKSDKRCYAKSRRGGSYGPTKDVNYNSMNMECDNTTVTETLKCLRKGINFPSSDLKSIVVADEAECVSHCQDTDNCKALTFNELNHYCYLKSKRGGYSGPTVALGYNSLNMECDNTKPTQLKCEPMNEQFPGHDMRQLVAANFEECLRRCRDTDGCLAVSFRETDNMCMLKKATFEWWQIKSHYISVNMDC